MYITSPVRLVLVFLFAFESRRNERGTLRKENQNSVLYNVLHFTGHFDAKIRCLEQFLTELLRIFTFNTCIMKN